MDVYDNRLVGKSSFTLPQHRPHRRHSVAYIALLTIPLTLFSCSSDNDPPPAADSSMGTASQTSTEPENGGDLTTIENPQALDEPQTIDAPQLGNDPQTDDDPDSPDAMDVDIDVQADDDQGVDGMDALEPLTLESLALVRREIDSLSDDELRSDIPVALQRLDDAFAAEAAAGFTGISLLSFRGTVIRQGAYGLRDQQTGEPMQVDTGFDMGSVTKIFTAAAILDLEAKGFLTLDEPVSTWLPSLEGEVAAVTPAQLLNHESGLPEYLGDDDELVDVPDAISRLSSYALAFEPGTNEMYSNAGYSLLALIIEAVSGVAFEDYLRANLLAPAGVTRIGYRAAGWSTDELAVGYESGRRWGTSLSQPWLDDGPSWTLRGNGGLLTSAAELDRWFEALFADRVLDTPNRIRLLEDRITTDLETDILNEAGGNDIFNALVVRWVSADLQMILFSSESTNTAEALAFTVLRDDFIHLALLIEAADTRELAIPAL